MKTSAWLAMLGFAVACLPATGSAQDRPPAREAFASGVAALRANDFPAAEAAFTRSQELEPRAATLCNLALTYDRWGDHESQAITSYLACADADDSGRFEGHARGRAEALRAQAPPEEPGPNPFAGAEGDRAPDPFRPSDASSPAPLAPGATRVTVTTEDSVDHGHGLLWSGLVSLAVSAGAFAGGFVLASDVDDTEAYLDLRYDGGASPIERGSEDARRLADAERKSSAAIGLYVLSGLTLALGATLITLDIATTRGGETATLGLSPLSGGGLLSARLELR